MLFHAYEVKWVPFSANICSQIKYSVMLYIFSIFAYKNMSKTFCLLQLETFFTSYTPKRIWSLPSLSQLLVLTFYTDFIGNGSHQVWAAVLTLLQPFGVDYAYHIMMSKPSFERHRSARD